MCPARAGAAAGSGRSWGPDVSSSCPAAVRAAAVGAGGGGDGGGHAGPVHGRVGGGRVRAAGPPRLGRAVAVAARRRLSRHPGLQLALAALRPARAAPRRARAAARRPAPPSARLFLQVRQPRTEFPAPPRRSPGASGPLMAPGDGVSGASAAGRAKELPPAQSGSGEMCLWEPLVSL